MKNQGAVRFGYRNGIVNLKLLGLYFLLTGYFRILQYILNAFIHSSVILFSVYLQSHLRKIGILLN